MIILILIFIAAVLSVWLLRPLLRRWVIYCQTRWAMHKVDDAYYKARHRMNDMTRKRPGRWDLDGF